MQMPTTRFTGLSTAKVAFATDLDETIHEWKDGAYKGRTQLANPKDVKKLNRFLMQNKDEVAFIANTSNSLAELQPHADLFDGAPLDAIVSENGRAIFLNKKEIPAVEWLKGLKSTDAEPGWADNWNRKAAKHALRAILIREGYAGDLDALDEPLERTLPNGNKIPIAFKKPTHAAFDLIVPSSEETFGKEEAERLSQIFLSLDKEMLGIELDARAFEFPAGDKHLFIRDFGPKGANKGTALQFTLNAMPALEKVITAGDNELNDLDAMKPETYLNRQGQPVQNRPIVVGNRSRVLNAMADHKYAIKVPTPSKVLAALKRHFKA